MLARSAQRFARPLVGRLAAARGLCTPSDAVRVEFDIPHVTHNIDMPPDFTYVTKTELLDMYELMFKMRRMEIAGDTLYKSKFVKGFCHLYDGQEAIVIGMEAAQPVIGKQALARSKPWLAASPCGHPPHQSPAAAWVPMRGRGGALLPGNPIHSRLPQPADLPPLSRSGGDDLQRQPDHVVPRSLPAARAGRHGRGRAQRAAREGAGLRQG